MKYLRTILICSLPAMLAACGGGGSDSSPSLAADAKAEALSATASPRIDIEPYMGTWAFCDGSPGARFSFQLFLTLDKTSNTTATILQKAALFETGDCSGAPLGKQATSQGTVNFAGMKLIGEDTAAKVDIKTSPVNDVIVVNDAKARSGQQIFVIKTDGKLYNGLNAFFPDAVFDSEGYPDSINLSSPFIKQ